MPDLPTLPPPVKDPHPPTALKMPPNACDTHCHLFGPFDRFPPPATRRYTPAEVGLEAYEHMQRRLGLTRAVFVQSAVYGPDHSVVLDALKRGRGRYAATALLPESVSDDEIKRLHDAGVRGTRFHFVPHLGKPAEPASVQRMADRLAKFGWHLLLHTDGPSLLKNLKAFEALPTPFIVDHMARVEAAAGLGQPGFQALLESMKRPHAWVKISGADRIGAKPAGPYDDVVPFARALVAAAPDRVLWGTDWPHTNVEHVADDGDLADLLARFVPDEATRTRILVDNPTRLYDFH